MSFLTSYRFACFILAPALLGPASVFAQQRIEEIVVTASPLSSDPNALATIVGQVDRNEILATGGANLADALANIPGVTSSGFASGASRPVIRGFDASRVRVLEDGIGSFDVSEIGPDHGVPIDPLSTIRIEVVRGPATLRYGSQAIGGVVNAINNRVPLTLPEQPFSGEVSGAYSSINDGWQGSALMDARAGQIAFHADGFRRDTKDYDTPTGTQPNSYFKGDGFSAGSSVFFGMSRVGAGFIHYNSEYGLSPEDAHIEMKQTKGMFGSSFALSAGAFKTLTVKGGYGDYEHSEIEPDGTIAATFKNQEWDVRSEGLFEAFGPFSSMALGVQFTGRKFSALGEAEDYLSPTTTHSAAGFFFSESAISNGLKLQLGARIEHVDTEGTPASGVFTAQSFTPFSGSAGLVYEPTSMVTLGLTATSAARAPSVIELFSHGPHDGPGTFETGDPTLSVERANSLEATARIRGSAVEVEAALWGTRFDNYIFGALTGNLCDEEGTCGDPVLGLGAFKELNYQATGAHFWGMEAKLSALLHESDAGGLRGEIWADYVRATLTNGGNVPRIPPFHIGAGVTWASAMFDANIRLTYSGEQTEVGAAETPTPDFVSLDAGVTIRPIASQPGLALSVIGRNLTDTVQRNATALNKDEVVLPGRDIRAVLRYSF